MLRKIISISILFTLLMSLACQVNAGASSKTLYDMDYETGLSDEKTFTSYDITGDKKADKIRIVVNKDSDDQFIKAIIYVNGQSAYTINRDRDVYDECTMNTFIIRWLRLSNGKPYLYVDYAGSEGHAVNLLLQYKSHALSKVIDMQTYYGLQKNNMIVQGYFKKVSGNQITVDFAMVNKSIGAINYTMSLKYKSGKFVPASTATLRNDAREVLDIPLLNAIKTKIAIQTYKKAGSTKKKAYKVPKNKKVKICKIYVAKNAVWFQMKYGSKYGWFKADPAKHKQFSNISYDYFAA